MKTTDIYEQVTSRIISHLEQGVVPWQSPYFSKVGFPRNFSTGNAYQGTNVFLLGSQRFTSPYFLTFIQAKDLGGHVRKGERGHMVVKYGTYTKEDEQQTQGDGEHVETRRYLKAYTVFHASQIEGIEFPAPANVPELSLTEKTGNACRIIEGMPHAPAFREGSAIPCYRPGTDCVHMPERGFFESEEAYYATLFHELVHSTGHASRLARPDEKQRNGYRRRRSPQNLRRGRACRRDGCVVSKRSCGYHGNRVGEFSRLSAKLDQCSEIEGRQRLDHPGSITGPKGRQLCPERPAGGAAMNALLSLSDVELMEAAQLSETEFDELENQLVIRAACLGWTGDPMRQPLEVVATVVRGILTRRA